MQLSHTHTHTHIHTQVVLHALPPVLNGSLSTDLSPDLSTVVPDSGFGSLAANDLNPLPTSNRTVVVTRDRMAMKIYAEMDVECVGLRVVYGTCLGDRVNAAATAAARLAPPGDDPSPAVSRSLSLLVTLNPNRNPDPDPDPDHDHRYLGGTS